MPPSSFDDVQRAVEHQDAVHHGYPITDDGMRLAVAALSDAAVGALEAWRDGRCRCSVVDCYHGDWSQLRDELIDIATVAVRAARSIDGFQRGMLWTGTAEPPPVTTTVAMPDGHRVEITVQTLSDGDGAAS